MSRSSHQVCKPKDGDSQNVELIDSHRSSLLNLHSCLNTEKSLHVMPELIPWIQSILACDVFSRTYFYVMYICEDMIENIKFVSCIDKGVFQICAFRSRTNVLLHFHANQSFKNSFFKRTTINIVAGET